MADDEYVVNYDIEPWKIARIDGFMVDVASDLDTLIASFRHHAARVEDTTAFTVLADNIVTLVEKGQLDTNTVCCALALAVQRLSKLEATDG